ncbi:H-NS family nucleoid-associated regulatory protein [Stenotrophomonas rhizophila]|uniref:hypothetical protein n=1 Tax=Stenotrophomonas TaxID=40323 RepID=UPI003B7E9BFE
MALTLEEIRKKKAEAEALVAEMERAEGDALAAEAGASFAGVYETLVQFGRHYSTKQKNDLRALLEQRPVAPAKTGASRAPKFQIPDGTTWAGTGRQPKAFLAWSQTSEGKAWKKKHPDQEWPAHPFKA